MIEVSKSEREIIGGILDQLHLETNNRQQLTSLMQGLGFESDVPFARSLFSDSLALIYKRHDGHYQKFIANDSLFCINGNTRQLLFKIFRIYHEIKIKQQGIQQLTLPDSNNMQEIIIFQKRMYELLRPLMPRSNRPRSQPSTAFSPFPNIEQDFMQPFMPGLASMGPQSGNISHHLSSFSQHFPEQSPMGMFPCSKTDPFMERHSLYLKRKSGQFANVTPPSPSPFLEYSKKQPKGFTAFGEDEPTGQPSKRLKRDQNTLLPCRESSTEKQKNVGDYNEQQLRENQLIKLSVSEYLEQTPPSGEQK